MGRGGAIFSISRAMAFASYAPTQIGSIVSLLMSLRMIIGVPLLGSIISARILTSISIFSTPLLYTILADSERRLYLPIQTIWLGLSHPNRHYFSEDRWIAGKIYDLMARRVSAHILC